MQDAFYFQRNLIEISYILHHLKFHLSVQSLSIYSIHCTPLKWVSPTKAFRVFSHLSTQHNAIGVLEQCGIPLGLQVATSLRTTVRQQAGDWALELALEVALEEGEGGEEKLFCLHECKLFLIFFLKFEWEQMICQWINHINVCF